MKPVLDFRRINAAALAAFPAVLARLLPGGKTSGATLSRSIRSGPTGTWALSASIAITGAGRTSPRARGAAIPCRLWPISRTFRRARRRGL